MIGRWVHCLFKWKTYGRLDVGLHHAADVICKTLVHKLCRLLLFNRAYSPDAKQFNCAVCDTSMTFGTHLV